VRVKPRRRLKTLLKEEAMKVIGKPDIEALLTKLCDENMTTAEIAKKYNVSPISVRAWLRRFDLKTVSYDRTATKRLVEAGYATWDEFFRANLIRTNKEMAAAIGIHWSTLSIYRKLWQVSKGRI
jgi:transposase